MYDGKEHSASYTTSLETQGYTVTGAVFIYSGTPKDAGEYTVSLDTSKTSFTITKDGVDVTKEFKLIPQWTYGTISIAPKELTIQASHPNLTYGDAVPGRPDNITVIGLLEDDNDLKHNITSGLKFNTAYTTTSIQGEYNIGVQELTFSEARFSNYIVHQNNAIGVYSVIPRLSIGDRTNGGKKVEQTDIDQTYAFPLFVDGVSPDATAVTFSAKRIRSDNSSAPVELKGQKSGNRWAVWFDAYTHLGLAAWDNYEFNATVETPDDGNVPLKPTQCTITSYYRSFEMANGTNATAFAIALYNPFCPDGVKSVTFSVTGSFTGPSGETITETKNIPGVFQTGTGTAARWTTYYDTQTVFGKIRTGTYTFKATITSTNNMTIDTETKTHNIVFDYPVPNYSGSYAVKNSASSFAIGATGVSDDTGISGVTVVVWEPGMQNHVEIPADNYGSGTWATSFNAQASFGRVLTGDYTYYLIIYNNLGLKTITSQETFKYM